MKHFSLLFIVLLFIGITACEDKTDDFYWEISPNSQSQVIEKEIDGIAFKFCLLNEQGKPATVFKEGENFSFYFSVTNKTKEKIIFEPNFVCSNDDFFCRIFNFNNYDFGKPYLYRGIDLIGIVAYELDINGICEFIQPWNDERDDWKWNHVNLVSSHKELLKKGDYNTKFEYNLEFVQSDYKIKFQTGMLSLKINFKIQ